MDKNNTLWPVWSVLRLSLSCLLCPCIQSIPVLSLSTLKCYQCQGFGLTYKGKTVTGLKSWERCHNRLLDRSQHKQQQLRKAVLHCLLAGKCVPLRHTPWEAVKDWTTLSFDWQLTHVPQVLCSRCNDNFTPWASSPTWLAEFQWVDKYQDWPVENTVAYEHVMHSVFMNSFSCKQSNPACTNLYYTGITWD